MSSQSNFTKSSFFTSIKRIDYIVVSLILILILSVAVIKLYKINRIKNLDEKGRIIKHIDSATSKIQATQFVLDIKIDSLLNQNTKSDSSSAKNIYYVDSKSVTYIRYSYWVSFLSLLLLVVALLIRNKKTKKILLISSAATLLLKGMIEFNVDLNPDIDINFNKDCPCDSIKAKVYTFSDSVGPFISGFSELDENSQDTYQKLADSIAGKRFTDVYIYGGVDKRPLKGRAKELYGDNVTLAQFRANSVKLFMQEKLATQSIQYHVSVQGAKYFAERNDSLMLSKSRYVVILGYLKGK